MGEEVLRTLRGIAGEISLFGAVLVIGDRTPAYCVDHKWGLTWQELRRELGDERGAGFHFEAFPGASPPAFFRTRHKILPVGGVPTTGRSYRAFGIHMVLTADRSRPYSPISSPIARWI